MGDLGYDGLACVQQTEDALQQVHELVERFNRTLFTADGVGYALKRTIKIARIALARCPMQPGNHVEFAKRYDCGSGGWAPYQHLFKPGTPAEVTAIDLDDRGYTATIRFDRETWFHDDVERVIEEEWRHVFARVPVEYLRVVRDE